MWRQKQTQGEQNIYPKELIFYLFLLLYPYDWNCCGLSSTWGSLLVPWALVVCRHLTSLNAFSNWATWRSALIRKMLFRITVCCVKKKSNKSSLKLRVFGTTTSRCACVCLSSTEEKQDSVGWVLPASLSPAALAAPGEPQGSLCSPSTRLCVLVLRAHKVCECAQGRVLEVERSPGGFHLCAVKEPGMYVGGWRATRELGFLYIGIQLCVTAVIYIAERVHLGSWDRKSVV